jgi:hypothetical protein
MQQDQNDQKMVSSTLEDKRRANIQGSAKRRIQHERIPGFLQRHENTCRLAENEAILTNQKNWSTSSRWLRGNRSSVDESQHQGRRLFKEPWWSVGWFTVGDTKRRRGTLSCVSKETALFVSTEKASNAPHASRALIVIQPRNELKI